MRLAEGGCFPSCGQSMEMLRAAKSQEGDLDSCAVMTVLEALANIK